ncbi:MAG: hypothetical protein K1W22_00965 [Lachnospiraceae bacterium]
MRNVKEGLVFAIASIKSCLDGTPEGERRKKKEKETEKEKEKGGGVLDVEDKSDVMCGSPGGAVCRGYTGP